MTTTVILSLEIAKRVLDATSAHSYKYPNHERTNAVSQLEAQIALKSKSSSNTLPLFQLFANAKEAGIQSPKITIPPYQFSLAPDTGKNPGYIYIKKDGDYGGKISSEGKITSNLGLQIITQLYELLEKPQDNIITSGKETGTCCLCNKLLTNSISIEQGIGPICAEKWGFDFPFEEYYSSLKVTDKPLEKL